MGIIEKGPIKMILKYIAMIDDYEEEDQTNDEHSELVSINRFQLIKNRLLTI